MIANCGHDERGKYYGGVAGDQDGSEWQIRSWYNRPWDCVLRYPADAVLELIAELSEEAARNDMIGYDQYQRETFWEELKESGFRPAQIKKACETDCSAGVAAIVKAAGNIFNIQKLKDVPASMYTGNEKEKLKKAGFEVLTDKKYLDSDEWLLRGDILLCEGHHTAINLTNGKMVGPEWDWIKDNGIWYYQNRNGKNTYGWRQIKERHGNHWHWYHFNDIGQMETGLIMLDGERYYLMESGDLEGALCVTNEYGALVIWDL